MRQNTIYSQVISFQELSYKLDNDTVLDALCDYSEITKSYYNENTLGRQQKIVDIKQIMAFYYYHSKSLGVSEIGMKLDRNHASVYAMLRKCCSMFAIKDKKFCEMIEITIAISQSEQLSIAYQKAKIGAITHLNIV